MPQSDRLRIGGTIWNGEAVLGSMMSVRWHWSPLATLTNLAFTVDAELTGGDTDLVGQVSPGFHSLRVERVTGAVDGALLAAAAPGLPVGCRFLARLDLAEAKLGGTGQFARGTLHASSMHCSMTGGGAGGAATLDLPASQGKIAPVGETSRGAILLTPPPRNLIEIRLGSDGALSIWPTANLTAKAPILLSKRLDTVVAW